VKYTSIKLFYKIGDVDWVWHMLYNPTYSEGGDGRIKVPG
jgi:hypothetical protein